MTFLEPVRDGLLDMWAYKARTVLQTLGITLGSASVIVTIALLLGGRQENKEFLETTGGVTTLEVRKATGGRQFIFARDKAPFGVTLEDVEAVREAVEPLEAIVSATRTVHSEIRFGNVSKEVELDGVMPSYAQLKHLELARGRFVAEGDVDTAAPVVVLGSALATKLFAGDDPLGHEVSFGHAGEREPRRYRVVGVLAEKFFARRGDKENWLAWMNDLAYV
ncbi:MAG TPA: ABC transporter permease, partial [bacterium]|nr:ABC transporter permease [bacterium]